MGLEKKNSKGTQKGGVDPNPDLHYQPAASFSPPQQFIDAIEWENGWPVIAENIKSAVKHGLVLMQLRNLWYYEIDGGYRYPTNDQYRTALTNNPNHRKLYALSLDNGSQPFLTVVQNAGFNNSSYSPMGPQPVIKVWPNGDEVSYTITHITSHAHIPMLIRLYSRRTFITFNQPHITPLVS